MKLGLNFGELGVKGIETGFVELLRGFVISPPKLTKLPFGEKESAGYRA